MNRWRGGIQRVVQCFQVVSKSDGDEREVGGECEYGEESEIAGEPLPLERGEVESVERLQTARVAGMGVARLFGRCAVCEDRRETERGVGQQNGGIIRVEELRKDGFVLDGGDDGRERVVAHERTAMRIYSTHTQHTHIPKQRQYDTIQSAPRPMQFCVHFDVFFLRLKGTKKGVFARRQKQKERERNKRTKKKERKTKKRKREEEKKAKKRQKKTNKTSRCHTY